MSCLRVVASVFGVIALAVGLTVALQLLWMIVSR